MEQRLAIHPFFAFLLAAESFYDNITAAAVQWL